jgi:hypothetical protein
MTVAHHDRHHHRDIHDRPVDVRHNADERLLPRFCLAVAITTAIAWLVLRAMQQSAEFDLTGHVETLLPLARVGLLTTPVIVAMRGGIATLTAWLVAGALNDRITLRTIAIGMLTWLPLLEIPALVDATAMLLQPEAEWSATHIPLGLDALMQSTSPRMQLLAQTVNLGLLAFTVLVTRHLVLRVAAGIRVAAPTALAVAVVLAVTPLFRV